LLCAPIVAATGTVRADRFDVLNFGAIPDDNIDDTAAINNAINAASAFPGTTVTMSTGTYRVSSQIIAKSDVSLVGERKDATILQRVGNSTTPLFLADHVSNVELANFTLDGNNLTRPSDGIYASTASNLNFHDLAVRNIATSNVFGPHGV